MNHDFTNANVGDYVIINTHLNSKRSNRNGGFSMTTGTLFTAKEKYGEFAGRQAYYGPFRCTRVLAQSVEGVDRRGNNRRFKAEVWDLEEVR